jgi:ribonuclease PH
MTANHEFIEVQGTGEGGVFSRDTMNTLLDLAETGITDLLQIQQKYV